MKSFRVYLLEDEVNWSTNAEKEYKEVPFQLRSPVGHHVKKVLSQLNTRDKFNSAVRSGTSRTLSPKEVRSLTNTQARRAKTPADFDKYKTDKAKKGRTIQAFKSGNVERPVVIHHDKGLHLLGGSHRATYAAAHNIPLQAHVIDMRTKKVKTSRVGELLRRRRARI